MGKIAVRTSLTDCSTAEQLLEKAGLMWEPEMRPAMFGGQEVQAAENFRAVVNPLTGAALSYVGQRYRPNSHIKAVCDLEPLMRTGIIAPHNASVWNGGQSMAIQFRCTDLDCKIGPKSVVSPLFTLALYHDGSGTDRSFFADFDFWCKNQAGMVAKIAGEGVRHTGEVLSKYEALVESRIQSLREGNRDRYNAMRQMAEGSKVVKGKDLVSYFARVLDIAPASVETAFSKPEVLDSDGKVLAAVVQDWRADDHGVPNSVWHAYSAITRYTTHTEGRNEGTRAARALLGTGQARFDRAFREAALLAA